MISALFLLLALGQIDLDPVQADFQWRPVKGKVWVHVLPGYYAIQEASGLFLWDRSGAFVKKIRLPQDYIFGTFFLWEDRLIISATNVKVRTLPSFLNVFVYDFDGSQLSHSLGSYFRYANLIGPEVYLPIGMANPFVYDEDPYPFTAQRVVLVDDKVVRQDESFGRLHASAVDLEYVYKKMYFVEFRNTIIGIPSLVPQAMMYDPSTMDQEKVSPKEEPFIPEYKHDLDLEGWRPCPNSLWPRGRAGDIEGNRRLHREWSCKLNLIEGVAVVDDELIVIYDHNPNHDNGECNTEGLQMGIQRFDTRFKKIGPVRLVDGWYMGESNGELFFAEVEQERGDDGQITLHPKVTSYPAGE